MMLIFIALFTGFFYLLGLFFESPESFLVIGLLSSVTSSFVSYYWSDKIVLKLVGAKPANKKEHFHFYTVVENLSLAAGLPKPKVYVIEDDAPNAFATGRDPKHAVVVATTGLLRILDRSDLEGVVAHELSHIKNYDILLSTVVAVLVGTIGVVSDFVLRHLWYIDDDKERRTNPILLILFMLAIILMPFIAQLIQLAISRRREFLADASAVMITRNPQGLIDALKKISMYPKQVDVSPSLAHLFFFSPLDKKRVGKFVSKLFSTHPPIEERIKALESLQVG